MKKVAFQLLLVLAYCLSSHLTLANADSRNSTFCGFEENKGQFIDMNGNVVPNVLFKLQTPRVSLYVTTTGITYLFQQFTHAEEYNHITKMGVSNESQQDELRWERVDMMLKNALISDENVVVRDEFAQGKSNYFLGHCPEGIRNVSHYEKLVFKNIYPNIDWVLYNSHETGFKYDFILRSGANPEHLRLVYRMKNQLNLIDGAINITTQLGSLVEKAPVSYLDSKLIFSEFKLESSLKNEFGGYDYVVSYSLDANAKRFIQDESKNHEMIIDPELQWGTFFGGNGSESSNAIKTDSQNNLYIAGYTFQSDFPVLSSTGYFQGTSNGSTELALMKFSEAGALLWSTYYGGGSYEYMYALEIDENDAIYCGGYTTSGNFPLQNAGTYFDASTNGFEDAFILKFNSQGDRLWATYIGGSAEDEIRSITAKNGVVYVVGYTASPDYPMMASGSYNQGTLNGYLDATIQKFDASGNLMWSTYYGGSGVEQANSAVIDNSGNVYITGDTHSNNFETQDAGGYFSNTFSGAIDGFILKFDPTNNRLWSTYFGGIYKDMGEDLAVDSDNNLFYYGYTQSPDMPLFDAGTFFQGLHTNLPPDANSSGNAIPFLAKFDPQGVMTWATYYGNRHSYNWQDQHNIAVDACGYLYCATIDAYGVEDQVPFVDNGYTNTWHGQSTRLSLFSSDGELLGATALCTMSGHGKYLICTGTDGYLWTSTTVNGFYPQNPLDVSTLPLMEGEANTYFDNTNGGNSDDVFINRFNTKMIDCEIIAIEPPVENPIEESTVPNVLTPNGDQSNDLYSLNISGASNIELKIYNRWGESVYTASGASPTWDGKSTSGVELNEGVYFIIYIVQNSAGSITSGQSFVHLVRD